MLQRRGSLVFVIAVASAIASPARADEAEKRRAAAVFDEAVGRFKRAEFAEAARGFDEADRIAPSAVAITNAIAAAHRASDHLWVARLAERAIARGDAVVEARAALAEAATRLAKLLLSCEPARKGAACGMTLDGDAAAEGTAWALPGTHRVIAESDLVAVEEHVACSAGATYRIALRPKARAKDAASAPMPPPPSRGMHRAVFFTGLGATAVLAGMTVGMGLDAMAAKRALPRDGVEQAQIDAVLGRARRTDFMLLGAGIAAIATTAIGVWWTDWKGVTATAGPVPGGAMITASGGFRGM